MNLNLSLAARIGLNIVALLGAITVLRLGSVIFLPLIFSVFLATILWPSAVRLNSFYKLPWTLACATAVGVLLLFNAVVIAFILLAVPKLLQSVPNPNDSQSAMNIYRMYDRAREQAKRLSPLREDEARNEEYIEEYLPRDPNQSRLFLTVQKTIEGEYILQAVFTTLSYMASYVWQFILVVFILLFILIEGRMLTRRVVAVFGPSSEVQGKVFSALQAMSKVVRDFLVWRTVVNIGLAIVVGTAYSLMGLRQAWVWGLLTGILCYIPYIGPIVAGAPALLDALVNTSPWMALAVLVFYTGIILIEGYLIVPMLMGRHMDLNATTVMLACLFWELVWGVPGLFLAMPLMGAIKAICEHVPGWEAWAALMSADESAQSTAKAVAPAAHVVADKSAAMSPGPARR